MDTLMFTHDAPARATLVQYVSQGRVVASVHILDCTFAPAPTISVQRPHLCTPAVLHALSQAARACTGRHANVAA